MGYKTALIDKIQREGGEARQGRVRVPFSLKLLGSIIAVPISEIVNPMIEEGLEPVQELVPEALSDLINIPRVAITVIDGVRDDALRALVTPALVNELAKIDAAA